MRLALEILGIGLLLTAIAIGFAKLFLLVAKGLASKLRDNDEVK